MLVVDIPAAGHDDRCPDDADVTGAVFRASRHPQLLGGGAELVRAANERENIFCVRIMITHCRNLSNRYSESQKHRRNYRVMRGAKDQVGVLSLGKKRYFSTRPRDVAGTGPYMVFSAGGI